MFCEGDVLTSRGKGTIIETGDERFWRMMVQVGKNVTALKGRVVVHGKEGRLFSLEQGGGGGPM